MDEVFGFFFLCVVVPVMFLPVWLTGSLTEMNDICSERRERALAGLAFSDEDVGFDSLSVPMSTRHLYNTISLLVSFVCFLHWSYASPHNSGSVSLVSMQLDKSLMSFFVVQLVGNTIQTVTSHFQCVASPTAYAFLWGTFALTLVGVNALGTNLLAHRYLLNKATVLQKAVGEQTLHEESDLLSIQRLKICFK